MLITVALVARGGQARVHELTGPQEPLRVRHFDAHVGSAGRDIDGGVDVARPCRGRSCPGWVSDTISTALPSATRARSRSNTSSSTHRRLRSAMRRMGCGGIDHLPEHRVALDDLARDGRAQRDAARSVAGPELDRAPAAVRPMANRRCSAPCSLGAQRLGLGARALDDGRARELLGPSVGLALRVVLGRDQVGARGEQRGHRLAELVALDLHQRLALLDLVADARRACA